MTQTSIPVIDLFSGPGGLGEGFAGLDEGEHFRITASAEMDPAAHATLVLRSYFRRLRAAERDLRAYYDYCHGSHPEPWNSRTLNAWNEAAAEARQLTLGSPEGNTELDKILGARLKRTSECILIGGPPCQAYSLVGRSRNRGKSGYRPEDDHRNFLYREYLRVIQRWRPAVFVMENVKGILSSRVGGRQIFHDILVDLVDPDAALTGKKGARSSCYRVHSLVVPTTFVRDMDVETIDPRDFVIHAEAHGVPQARHRVVLFGVREDIDRAPQLLKASLTLPSVAEAIADLPRLRSRLTRTEDSARAWAGVVKSQFGSLAIDARRRGLKPLSEALADAAGQVSDDLHPGGVRIPAPAASIGESSSLTRRLGDRVRSK